MNASKSLGRRSEIDMLNGPLLGKILVFVFPLIVTNLLQTFYNAADMMVVSLSSEADAVGAIGTTGSFVNMVVNIFIGFSAGANVVAARYIGAGDREGVSKTVHTSICMSLIFGLVGMVTGLLVSHPVLRLMGNTGRLLELAVLYTMIYFCGVPFISLTNYCISIFRAKGDTRTPLVVLSLSGLLNVLLNFFFVMGCHMSVEGVALATSIANIVSAAVLLRLLNRDMGVCHFSPKLLRIDKHAFMQILHIGLPAGIYGSLFSLSNVLIQSSIISVNNAVAGAEAAYQPVVTGNAAAGNLEGFVYTATNAVCQASITFTSQNMGAGKYRRVGRVMLACYFVTTCVALLLGGILILAHEPLLALYGVKGGPAGSLDAIAMESAAARIYYLVGTYVLLAFMEVGTGVLRGMGRSITSTVVALLGSCLLRVVWLLTVFRAYGTLVSIYLSYPVSWFVTGAVELICCLFILHHLMHPKDGDKAIEKEAASL